MSISKRVKAYREKVDPMKVYNVTEAIDIVKSCATAKFNENIDVCVNLGVNAKQSDQNVRGAVVLPHGTGKVVRVAVFAQGDNAKKANDAGADVVGLDDLAEQVKSGEMDFDVVIATPDTMRVVGQLGQILGPRGLMPNPKVGTVTMDVEKAVANAKSGQVRFRNDKNGIIHCSIGKADFSVANIHENLAALLETLKQLKPSTAKGVYFKKLTLTSTMGPGLTVDMSTL